jgi:hypothetical protein
LYCERFDFRRAVAQHLGLVGGENDKKKQITTTSGSEDAA